MPRPDQVTVNPDGSVFVEDHHDPNVPVQQANAQMLAETGNGLVGGGGAGFPSGLVPQQPVPQAEGLPTYLTDPGQFVQAPTDLLDPETLSPAARAAMGLELAGPPASVKGDSEKNKGDDAKLKCPSCKAENSAAAKKCKRCKRSLVGIKGGNYGREYAACIYNALNLSQGQQYNDLHWVVACKTGTLKLSPGPNQEPVEQPLELTKDLLEQMSLSVKEKCYPHLTVPETHTNGALENTGYVRDHVILSRDELLQDPRLSEANKPVVEADPEDTHYLLAGVEFTDSVAKRKAAEGSIPDKSVGVKFNVRNTRTGKFYPAAWEHLALTPVPWVDGLLGFGLGQRHGVFDQEQQVELLGVYVPESLELGMRISQEGDDYSESQARQAIASLAEGDEWSWSYEVRVKVAVGPGGDTDTGANYYVLTTQKDDYAGLGGDETKVFESLDKLVPAVSSAVAACQARRVARRAKALAVGADTAVYSRAQDSEAMNLAVTFDPKKHPRDWKGKFRKVLKDLDFGDSVKLPDGTRVTKSKGGVKTNKWEGEVDYHVSTPKLEAEGQGHEYVFKQDQDDPDEVIAKVEAESDVPTIQAESDPNRFRVVPSKLGRGAPEGQWTQHSSGDLEIEMPDNGPTARITQDERGGRDKWGAYVFPSGDSSDYEERTDFYSAKEAREWVESRIEAGDIKERLTKEKRETQIEDDALAQAVERVDRSEPATPESQVTDRSQLGAGHKVLVNDPEYGQQQYQVIGIDDGSVVVAPSWDSPTEEWDWVAPEDVTHIWIGFKGEGYRKLSLGPSNRIDDPALVAANRAVVQRVQEAKVENRDAGRKLLEGLAEGDVATFADPDGPGFWRVERKGDEYAVLPPDGRTRFMGLEEAMDELYPDLDLSRDQNVGSPQVGALPGEGHSGGLPSVPERKTPTVEQLLASQQAELESSQQKIQQLEADLQLAQGTVSRQGESLHTQAVERYISGLNGKLPPSVLLSAKEIMLEDKSVITLAPEDEGLNLSLHVPKEGSEGDETEERVLRTPTDIVQHLLASLPTGEEGGEATRIASTLNNIQQLHASAHEEANAEEEAVKAVEALERKRHPERFKDGGKGERVGDAA